MSEITYTDVVENIRFFMSANLNGYKQCAIAERGGYGEKEFSNMLNGRKRIQVYDIPKLAKALGVTPNDLLSCSEKAGGGTYAVGRAIDNLNGDDLLCQG